MNKYALIVAGGIGKRMDSQTPKQFKILADKPLLFHSLTAFSESFEDIEIIVAIPEEYFRIWETICSEFNIKIKHKLVKGGKTRFHSVKNGLAIIDLKVNGIVAIHDAARPLLTKNLIKELFAKAEKYGNAIPAISLNDSIREITESVSKPKDRNDFRLIQTPQCFTTQLLNKAYNQNYKPSFTDDATVVETTGEIINLVEGDRNNIKITTPADLIIAGTLYKLIHKW